jgi:hypothetical protein
MWNSVPEPDFQLIRIQIRSQIFVFDDQKLNKQWSIFPTTGTTSHWNVTLFLTKNFQAPENLREQSALQNIKFSSYFFFLYAIIAYLLGYLVCSPPWSR